MVVVDGDVLSLELTRKCTSYMASSILFYVGPPVFSILNSISSFISLYHSTLQ